VGTKLLIDITALRNLSGSWITSFLAQMGRFFHN